MTQRRTKKRKVTFVKKFGYVSGQKNSIPTAVLNNWVCVVILSSSSETLSFWNFERRLLAARRLGGPPGRPSREEPVVCSHHMVCTPQAVSLLADTRATHHLGLSIPQFWKFEELHAGFFPALKAGPSKEGWQQSPENNLKSRKECLNF